MSGGRNPIRIARLTAGKQAGICVAECQCVGQARLADTFIGTFVTCRLASFVPVTQKGIPRPSALIAARSGDN